MNVPQHTVYIIFTSGSTGVPKGVAISHQSLVNYSTSITRALDLEQMSGEHALQFANVSTIAADLGNTVIFPALLCGGCLHMLGQDVVTDAGAFTRSLAAHAIDVLKIVPSHFRALLTSHACDRELMPRRYLIFGGEALPWELVDRLAAASTGCRIINHYGPTETTVGALMGFVEPRGSRTASSPAVPLGRPIANTEVYILDQHLRPLPPNVPGEICIGGDGVARGYLGQPALTAERFVPCPWSVVSSQLQRTTDNGPLTTDNRLYRTGDRGRCRADGVIEFLGRADHQIKIRGFRVEIGEIEAALCRHPAVREAVVLAGEDTPGEQRLVAYIVSSQLSVVSGQLPSSNNDTSDNGAIDFAQGKQRTTDNGQRTSELRAFLRDHLPEYMLPSAFVYLRALPLTANGKIDRQALAALATGLADHDAEYIAPRTPVEEIVSGIWSQILGVSQVGIQQNFFELGGHSLLATQVLSRIRAAFQVELPIHTLFNAPTVAGFAQAIAGAQLALKGLLAPPIAPAPRGDELPLSFAQQRLWFLDQLSPGSTQYNMPLVALRLRGRIDLGALEQSIGALVQRHESLRTTFPAYDGRPIQVIAPATPALLDLLDLRDLPEAERQQELRRLIEGESQRPFDLSAGPLLRITVIRAAESEVVLLLAQHHIISDGWSSQVLFREFAACYDAFARQQPLRLPELPVQYADFALWQQEWLRGEVLEAHLSFWRGQLAGELPALSLPTDRPRPAIQTFRGARHSSSLPDDLYAALKQLSRQEHVTLFMTLAAGFATLLWRYTQQTDIVIGTPIANRNRAEIEGLIGFFVNTLVLRFDLGAPLSFRELLAHVRATALAAYEHQDLPFEKLVEMLNLPRDLSRTPIFQVMFVFNEEHAPFQPIELPGLTIAPLTAETQTAKFDLTLVISERADTLFAAFEYNADLFDETTIERILGHFQTLLYAATTEPGQPIADLPLMTGVERQQLLGPWAITRSPAPRVCFHRLFEAQAERTPDAIAVNFEDQQLSYDELNRRANHLAHYLQARQVAPGTLVGICMARSVELIVAMLGVVKAGGAYVPLDPAYPAERLRYMLDDAQVSVLLTNEEQRTKLVLSEVEGNKEQRTDRTIDRKGLLHTPPANPGQPTMIDLVADWEQIARQPATNLDVDVAPDHLAYIIYTSGSTGRPKGVLVSHAGLSNLALAQIAAFEVKPGGRVLQFASFSFDAAISEVMMALLAGATLVMAPPESLRPGADLLGLLRAQAISTVTLPPAALALLPVEELPQLRTIVVAGEPCPVSVAAAWGRRQRVINAYGPTEASVCATLAPYLHDEPILSIGLPIANVEVYLLDAQMEPVPVGVPGELVIGGDGLAWGYLNHPALTAERFVPNPFAENKEQRTKNKEPRTQDGHPPSSILHPPSSRLYRTGDLARRLPDGRIMFIGRLDSQVKVRGFRIELGEIEALLATHPGVRVAAAQLDETPSGDRRIVAYIVPNQEQRTKNQEQSSEKTDSQFSILNFQFLDELRALLKQRLPEYMIPAAFVLLDALPLTVSGKIDRRRLPAPDVERAATGQAIVGPRDLLELRLQRIWEELFHLRPIGVTDDFFALGGHSLLAVQLLAQIQRHFDRALPLVTLFQQTTIERLATLLRQGSDPVGQSPLIGLKPTGARAPFFCIHPVGGSVMCYTELARHMAPDQPFYAIQAPALDGRQAAYKRVEDMAAHYVELIRAQQPYGPYLIGGWSFGGVVAFEVAQRLQEQGQPVGLVALLDSGGWEVEDEPRDISDTQLVLLCLGDLARQLGGRLPTFDDRLEALSSDEQLDVILAQCQAANLFPIDLKTSQLRHHLEVFRANIAARRSYTPRVFAGKITLLRAAASVQRAPESADQGWRHLAGGGVDLRLVPGNHYSILSREHVQDMAEQLRQCIEAAHS